ncbi:MAG: sigma-70 family RNA polymerase sigma factor [Cyclobacteriaceae bacterium]
MKNKHTLEPINIGELKQLIPLNDYLPQDKKDEGMIWLSFQEGSEEALIYIYRKYASVVYNYGCQFTNDKEYVWDCVQDLFCELIKNRKKLGKVISIKGYLFKAIKRKIFKGLKKINKTMILDSTDGLFEISISSGITSIGQTSSQDQNQIIESYINKLPPHQREILLLYFYEGLSYQEIANIFEVKVKSIRTMTYRALEKLSVQLKADKDIILPILLAIML